MSRDFEAEIRVLRDWIAAREKRREGVADLQDRMKAIRTTQMQHENRTARKTKRRSVAA